MTQRKDDKCEHRSRFYCPALKLSLSEICKHKENHCVHEQKRRENQIGLRVVAAYLQYIQYRNQNGGEAGFQRKNCYRHKCLRSELVLVEHRRADEIIRERKQNQKRRSNKGHEFLRDNQKYKRNGGYQKDKVFIELRRQVIPQKAALKQSEHYVVDIP